MKYIRTKDGIFEVYKETENGYNINTKPFLETTKTRCYLNPFISKEKVINQADTIEELCDEFVCLEDHRLLRPRFTKFNDEGYATQTYHEGILNAFREGVNYKNFHWVGAIWTSKGLIYVAKMNENGELELL